MKPAVRKVVVQYSQDTYPISERRACCLFRLSRTVKRYQSVREDDPLIIDRIKALAEPRRRWGYRQLHRTLTREGVKMNQKKFRRIYNEQKLSLKIRMGRKVRSMPRAPIAPPTGPNQRWSMDFMSDSLGTTVRCFRVLTVVDDFTRECVLLHADFSIPGQAVTRALSGLKNLPKIFNIDNGSEFTGRVMDEWHMNDKSNWISSDLESRTKMLS